MNSSFSIKKLDKKNKEVSKEIHAIFQASYRVEAEILNVEVANFPPLRRKLSEFINSDTEFYGVIVESKIVAVVEISFYHNVTDIDSLVVHPEHFRKGYGKQLMKFALETFQSEIFTVETGLENIPATTLYKQLGFQEQEQWDTEFGVRKIKFRRVNNNMA